jgi:trehalose-6-phosphatase
MKSTVNDNKLSELVEKIKDARQRLILLDFDGTLVDFKPDISAAVPSRNLLV